MHPLPDVLYCIEHVARELNIASAVRAIAKRQHGLDVHVHVLSSKLDERMGPPRLITVPFCASRRFVPRAVLKQFPQTPVLNLACEQLLSHGNRRYRLPKDDVSRRQIMHAAAGDFFRDWLLGAGVAEENIEVVGSLPFQLYREPYRQFFEGRRGQLAARHNLDIDLPWVLFPENFGAAFFTLATARKRLRGGYDPQELWAYIQYARQSFEIISRWCAEAAACRQIELIIRPRPAITHTVFTKRFFDAAGCERLPHLHFIKEGTIQEWILASQLVVSSYSTTLLEAAVASRPAFLLAPVSVPPSASSDWHASAPMITTRDAFLDILQSPCEGVPADRLREWAEHNLLGRGDAIVNVAQLFADICAGRRATPRRRPPPLPAIMADRLRDSLSWPERCFRNRMRPGRRRVFGHECDAIARQEIDARGSAWSRLLDDRQQAA